ncbi:PHP domain-containing protein [Candidatus Bathyarchaeota archaeon]|nr:PHP domain-containing protein [Candidatus Bathyarchaeota archaeon]
MRLKLDLHVHSVYSGDSLNTIDTIVERIKAVGFDGYALTDHDTLDGIPEALRKKGDLAVIPAAEITARGAHVLALLPSEPIEQGLSIAETVDRIHEQGATAVLAHPYGLPRSWVSIHAARKAGLDAIEVANSAQFPFDYICGLNRKLAEELGLPVTGGSDAHIPAAIGRCYTIVDTPTKEPEDVVEAIRKGRTEIGGSGITIWERFRKTLKKG